MAWKQFLARQPRLTCCACGQVLSEGGGHQGDTKIRWFADGRCSCSIRRCCTEALRMGAREKVKVRVKMDERWRHASARARPGPLGYGFVHEMEDVF